MDFATSTFYCMKCGAKAIDPWDNIPEQAPPVKKRVKKTGIQPDPRPPVPTNAGVRDVVEDFFVPYASREFPFDDDGDVEGKRVLVSRTYCPKVLEKDDSKFDPSTPYAQFYLKYHAKRFKNRRRYNRDLKKRKREESLTE
jgi:hypothetical protein